MSNPSIPPISSTLAKLHPSMQLQSDSTQGNNALLGELVMNMLKVIGADDAILKVKVLTPDRVSSEKSSDEGSRNPSPAIPIRRGRSSSTPPTTPSAYSQDSSETETTSTQPSTSSTENNSEDSSDTSLIASPRTKSVEMHSSSSPEDSVSRSLPLGRSLSGVSRKNAITHTIQEESELISDEEKGMEILKHIHRRIHKEKDISTIKKIMEKIWGLRTSGQVPRIELHRHLEGSFNSHTLVEWVKKYKLYYDEGRKVFRRKAFCSKPQETGTVQSRLFYENMENGEDWLTELIEKHGCVSFDPKKPKNNRKKFNDAFPFIGSITDRVPLSDQIQVLYSEALEYNIKLNEWMFGTYLVPVPKKFEDLVNSMLHGLCGNPEEMKGVIKECLDYLFQNTLGTILEDREREKFKKKLETKYTISYGTYSVENDKSINFDDLMAMTYPQAFKTIMDKELSQLDKNIFDPKDPKTAKNIFDPKEPITAKLIFEVMRHYGLYQFLAWAAGAFSYIQQDNYKVVGITVDGPEDWENSKKFFLTHCEIIKYLRTKYPKVRVTFHGLEFAESEYKAFQTAMGREVDILASVLASGDRVGHASSTEQTKNQLENLHKARLEKFVEICLSTVMVTTGRTFQEIPLMDLYNEGVPVGVFTDDPGIVKTTLKDELLLAIRIYKLSPDDIKVMLQSSYEHFFLEGEGIYKVSHVHDRRNPSIRRLKYTIKDQYQVYISDPNKKIDDQCSTKAHKQIQFERDWNDFLRFICSMKAQLSPKLLPVDVSSPSDSYSLVESPPR